jgi:HEAT repeat protein
MGWMDAIAGLFDKEQREARAFDKLVTQLLSKNRQHEERMAAIEALATMNTARANAALLRRFDVQGDKAREDAAEKDYLGEVLIAKGDTIVPVLREHNDRSINITLPIQILQRVAGDDAVVEELVRVMTAELDRVASFKPEKKVRALQLIADHDDDRIEPLALRALHDFDANVRFEAVQLLERSRTQEVRDALIDRLNHGDEDSGRIRDAIVDALVVGGFTVTDRKTDLEGHLGERWRIGPKNTLIPAS